MSLHNDDDAYIYGVLFCITTNARINEGIILFVMEIINLSLVMRLHVIDFKKLTISAAGRILEKLKMNMARNAAKSCSV